MGTCCARCAACVRECAEGVQNILGKAIHEEEMESNNKSLQKEELH